MSGWDTSLEANKGIGGIILFIAIGLVIIFAKLFGYVMAFSETVFAIIVTILYLKVLYELKKRKENNFIVISIILYAIGVIIGFFVQPTIDNIQLKIPFANMFFGSIIILIAGLFYPYDLPFYSGEKGWDIFYWIIKFINIVVIIYIVSFIFLWQTNQSDMYNSSKWLVTNTYIENRLEKQTSTDKELLEKYIKSNLDNKEDIKNTKKINEYLQEQYYYCKITELNNGNLQYTISNKANPNNITENVYVIDQINFNFLE